MALHDSDETNDRVSPRNTKGDTPSAFHNELFQELFPQNDQSSGSTRADNAQSYRVAQAGTDTRTDAEKSLPSLELFDSKDRPNNRPSKEDLELRERIANEAKRLGKEDLFSGNILVFRNGEQVFSHSEGLAVRSANPASEVKIDENTRFRAASMGKMFTAAAIHKLAEEGKLNLNDTLDKFNTGYPDNEFAKKVTLKMLLSHRSGIGGEAVFGPSFYLNRDNLRNTDDFINSLGIGDRVPQNEFHYSNYAYILLGKIIENTNGEGLNYADYLQKHIFGPLKMNSTGLEPEKSDKFPSNVARPYSRSLVDGIEDHEERTHIVIPTDASDTLPYSGTPAGGAYTTTHDMMKFGEALRTGKLFKNPETLKQMQTAVSDTANPNLKYGLGLGIFIDKENNASAFGHSGGAEGTSGRLRVYPDSKYTVVILSNQDDYGAITLSNFIKDEIIKRNKFAGDLSTGPKITSERSLTTYDLGNGPYAERVNALHEKYGVDITIRNGKFSLSYKAGSKEHFIKGSGELKANKQGFEKLQEMLDKSRLDRMQSLEKLYSVKFRPVGEFIGNQLDLCAAERGINPPEDPNAPTAIRSRLPNFKELHALQGALSVSKDSLKTRNGDPLVFTFTDKAPKLGSTGESSELARFESPDVNDKKRSEIFIHPSRPDAPVTDLDARHLKDPYSSLDFTIRHEIAHSAVWNAYQSMEMPLQMIRRLGFERVPNITYGGEQHESTQSEAVRGKLNGKEMLFMHSPASCDGGRGGWFRVNERGEPLTLAGEKILVERNRNGKAELRLKSEHLQSNEWMKAHLSVKHPTTYFDSSGEVIAEVLAMASGSPEMRAKLAEKQFQEHARAIKEVLEAQREALRHLKK